MNAQGANTAIAPTRSVYPEVDNVPVRELEARATELENQATELEASDPAGAEELRAQAQDVRAKVEAAKGPGTEPIPPRPGGGGEAPLDPNLRHLPRGLSVMLLEPFPVPFGGSISLKLARLESLPWYSLLLVAAIGLWNVRPHLRQMVFPLLTGGGIVVMYALSEGNVGTAHRHRGEFVWVVALLAAIGLSHLTAHRRGTSTEDA